MYRKLIVILLVICCCACSHTATDKSDTNSVTCIQDLKGHTVAFMSGALSEIVYSDTVGEGAMRLGTAPDVLAACESGRAEYCMMDSIHFIGSHAEEKGLCYCYTDTLGGVVGVGFNKDDAELCKSYNDWLSIAQAEGTMQEIINRWTKGDIDKVHMPYLGPAPEGKPIRVGITSCFPFSFLKNNQWMGLEIEMAERWGRSVGRPIEFQVMEFKSLIMAVQTNKIDAICCFMYITPERSKQVLFSNPYFSSHTVVFGHKPKTEEELNRTAVKTIQDLKGHTVAFMSGALSEIVYSDTVGEGAMRLGTAPDVLAACESGRAEFCMMDSIHFIGSHAEEKGLYYCYTDTLGGVVGVGFNKSNTDLCRSYNQWLVKAQAEGTMQHIINRWTQGDIDQNEMPDLGPAPKGKPIRVGITSCYPFSFLRNNEWIGLEIEMAERWGRSIGRPVEFQVMEFKSLIMAVQTNKIDAICCFMYITPERSKQVLFSMPYFSSHTVVFGHQAKAEESHSWWSNLGKRFNDNFIQEGRWRMLLSGLWETILISLLAILFGSILGALLCWMLMCRFQWLKTAAKVWVGIIRGIPIVVFLMILFYIVFASAPITARWVAIIAFAINFSVYACEIYRTGILSVDRGQAEAALSMGFRPAWAFYHIVMPQAVTRIIPVYKAQVVSLIKSTSVVGYIAIQDLTMAADIIRSRTFDAFLPLIFISLIYLLLAFLIAKLLDWILVKRNQQLPN